MGVESAGRWEIVESFKKAVRKGYRHASTVQIVVVRSACAEKPQGLWRIIENANPITRGKILPRKSEKWFGDVNFFQV
jgi:hypothetical protein